MKRTYAERLVSGVKAIFRNSDNYDKAVETLRPTAEKLVAEKKAATKSLENAREVDEILSL